MVTKILNIITFIKTIPTILKELPSVITILKKVLNILKGWYYKLFNKKEDIAKNRLEICKYCDNRVSSALGDACSLCGCILDAKTRVKDEHCEVDKW